MFFNLFVRFGIVIVVLLLWQNCDTRMTADDLMSLSSLFTVCFFFYIFYQVVMANPSCVKADIACLNNWTSTCASANCAFCQMWPKLWYKAPNSCSPCPSHWCYVCCCCNWLLFLLLFFCCCFFLLNGYLFMVGHNKTHEFPCILSNASCIAGNDNSK